MVPCLWGLAGLGFLAVISPARAEMHSFTIGGQQFRFDIPADYDEFAGVSDDTHKAWINADSIITFSITHGTIEEEFASDKDAIRRFDGRVGLAEYDGRDPHFKEVGTTSYLGRVFTSACSGKCVIVIGIMGHANDPRLSSKLHPVLEKYLKILGRGEFDGN
jgi:hypothetical protein